MSEGWVVGDGRARAAAGSPNVPPGYKRTEVGVIPEDWESSSVGAIASSAPNAIVGGPFGSELVSKDYVAHGVPVIRGQNMGGRWVSGDFVFVSPTKAKALKANQARPGDIVFTQRGTLGQVSLVPEGSFRAYLVSQSQMKLSVDRSIAEPVFVFYFFTSHAQRKSIQSSAIQTGVPHINLGILRALPIRLPPLAQQRAIAAVLSDVDEMIGSLEALIAKKRDIKKVAMQQLLTGRMRLPGFGGEWEVTELGRFVRIRDRKVSPVPFTADTPCVELEHIGQGDGRLASHSTAGQTASIKYQFEPRDILFGRLRPYLRKWWYADRGGVCSTEIWPLAADRRKAESGFVYALVQTDRFLEAAETSYGTHMPRADWNIVSGIEFPLPSLPEQRAIAAVLSDMDAETGGLERRLDKTRAIKQGMMQQLLTGSIRLPILDDADEGRAHDA